MDLPTYQQEATRTDQGAGSHRDPMLVPLLGLAGEVGSLHAQYKKLLRDGHGHALFQQAMADHLGDLLWYIATVASRLGLSLDEIAGRNLTRTRERWLGPDHQQPVGLFDDDYPPSEQLPRRFEIRFCYVNHHGSQRVRMTMDGTPVGDPLSDNAYDDIGYRWHDALHLGHLAMLGWSPVLRTLLGCRRASDPIVNEVEDGGRAKVMDEGIAALAYDYARKHHFLEGVAVVDASFLTELCSLTVGLEVQVRTAREWERAILAGFGLFRELRRHDGGIAIGDLHVRTLTYRPG